MDESLIINSLLPKVLLHVLTLHECKVGIHVTSPNKTTIDNRFMSEIIPATGISIVVQDSSLDLSYETNDKACITSFSERALDEISFNNRHKRPIKILLGNFSKTNYAKPNYRPIVIEQPPLVSITTASYSSSNIASLKAMACLIVFISDTFMVTTLCPEVNKTVTKPFYFSEEFKELDKLPTCIPDLTVSTNKTLCNYVKNVTTGHGVKGDWTWW